MLYVKDSNILTLRQLLQSVKVARAEPPRQQDLDDWGAFELQPDAAPIGDIVQALQTASESGGLWYRDYSVRAFTTEELTAYRKNGLQQINSHMDQLVNNLADYYPPYERDTWPQQESEARAHDADPVASTPVMDAIMTERGLTDRAAFAANVIAKADAYRTLAASYAGKRQAYRDQINAATTKADIDAIVAQVLAL